MDKTTILKYLGILSDAKVGHKLSKATGEWYASSGIFSALYRTMTGDSRNGILEIMDEIITGLVEFRGSTDINAKNQIILAIAEATGGCDNIMETYRDDQKFIDSFVTKLHDITSFKEPKKKNNEPQTERQQLRKYQSASALGYSVTCLNGNNRPGVEYINKIINSDGK